MSLLRFSSFIINPKFGNRFALGSVGFPVLKKVILLCPQGRLTYSLENKRNNAVTEVSQGTISPLEGLCDHVE